MATIFDAPAQYERDLRSARKDSKRFKDASTKWSYGVKPLHGVPFDWTTLEPAGGNESQRAKNRPLGRNSDESGHPPPKEKHNITKMNRGSWELPSGRVRSKFNMHEELSEGGNRSIIDLLPQSAGRRATTATDNILYSFDRTDSPGRPVTLDIFVKSNGRETEKLVTQEYEVLDTNGDALRGRKARTNLRKGPSTTATVRAGTSTPIEEDDGFELV